MLFTPFMWPSSFSAMPLLIRRFASVVLPSMNLHGRVNVFVGRFTRPSQAGRFDALQRPRRSSHKLVSCVPRGAFRRENQSFRRWIFASKGDLRRFIQSSIFSHISCFSLNPHALPQSSRFVLFRWKV
jgi:hypothetical protein